MLRQVVNCNRLCTSLLATHIRSISHVVDLRSDVLTLPSEQMLDAMKCAKLGDDVFEECPTTNELQEHCADLFGMEAALFVPSGTMGNLLSLMSHCINRGSEILVGDQSHIYLFEQGGAAQLAGVHSRSVSSDRITGEFDLTELENKIRYTYDVHLPLTKLICLENSLNGLGGLALSPNYFSSIRSLADKHNLSVHCDGARIFNVTQALNVNIKEFTKHIDSISVCFSKGLGCPVGSIVGGSYDFIKLCRRFRKAVGGGLRQSGVLAAAAKYALDHQVEDLTRDNNNAVRLAKVIQSSGGQIASTNLSQVHTNIVMLKFTDEKYGPEFVELCEQADSTQDEVSVKMLMFYDKHVARLVTNRDQTQEDIERAKQKITNVLKLMNDKYAN